MFYDTLYRHNQALSLAGLESASSALHALNAAADDCRRAGKPIALDASILLLIRNLAMSPNATRLAQTTCACAAPRTVWRSSPPRPCSTLRE